MFDSMAELWIFAAASEESLAPLAMPSLWCVVAAHPSRIQVFKPLLKGLMIWWSSVARLFDWNEAGTSTEHESTRCSHVEVSKFATSRMLSLCSQRLWRSKIPRTTDSLLCLVEGTQTLVLGRLMWELRDTCCRYI